MDPTTVCCPKLACPASGHVGEGNLGIHSRKDQRFRCPQCRNTCTATQGTACYRVRPSAETVTRVATLASPRSSSAARRGVLSTSRAASWLGHPHGSRRSSAVHTGTG